MHFGSDSKDESVPKDPRIVNDEELLSTAIAHLTSASVLLQRLVAQRAREVDVLSPTPDRSMLTKERMAFTIPEAADALRISRSHLYNLIKRGELTVVRLGGAVRITVKELDRYIDLCENG